MVLSLSDYLREFNGRCLWERLAKAEPEAPRSAAEVVRAEKREAWIKRVVGATDGEKETQP
jgi:hypothetical protein